DRSRRDRGRRGVHVLVHRGAVRAASVPLPFRAARRAHLEGPVRRVHRRPEGGTAACGRAADDAERVRPELQRRQRGLRRQHGCVPLSLPPGPGEPRGARPDLSPEHRGARPDQLVPHPRELLPSLSHRDVVDADRVHGHRDPGARAARHPRAALPLHGAVHVPRTQDRVRVARVDGDVPRRRMKVALALVVVAASLGAGFVAMHGLPGGSGGDEVKVTGARLEPGRIVLTLESHADHVVSIAQAIVNDSYVNFDAGTPGSAEIAIDYPWIEGGWYETERLTSTGSSVDFEIAYASSSSAAASPLSDLGPGGARL